MKESDLYLPLKRFLESQHYEVKGEVHVILQAVQRLSLTPKVYIGIPGKCGVLKRRRKHTIKLFRMLGLALGEPKARDFVYRDVYGWFDRASLGVYDLSPRGRREIAPRT